MQLHTEFFEKYPSQILAVVLAATGIVIFNPITSIDALIVTGLLCIAAHHLFHQQLFLIFLLLRPAIDTWRDVVAFSFQHHDININAIYGITFLGWCCAVLIQYRHDVRRLPTSLLAMLGILTSLVLISIITSVNTGTSITEAIKFLSVLAVFLTAFVLIKNKFITLKQLLYTFIFSAILPILFALIQLVTASGLTTFDTRGRLFGTFAHPNVFAFFLLFLGFTFIQYSFISPTKYWQKHTTLKIITAIGLLTLIALTYTRAAYIGLIVFLVVLGLMHYRKLLLSLMAIIIMLYGSIFLSDTILRKTTGNSLQEITLISRLISRNEDADSIAWRQVLLRETTPIILAKPVFGYGYGTFPFVWENQRGTHHLFDDSAEAHNDYLRLSLELGVIGIATYLLLLISFLLFFYRAMKFNEQKYAYLFAWGVAFAALSLSDNMLHHTPVMWLMWAWWGAIAAELLLDKTTIHWPNFLLKD